jgi:outer membrane receptor protein involved in Fe transport
MGLALALSLARGAHTQEVEGDTRAGRADEQEQVEQAEPAPDAAATPRSSEPRSDIEEIVVQAGESDAVSDLKAADSVTAFDASDLEALGAQSVEDIAGFTPNLEIVTTGATTPTFFIRGVGLNDFAANSTGAVAIYQDDVPKNAQALQLGTLFDVEGVNVLRGPQGTGPARNASAGAIKVYSRKPTGEFGGYLRSEIGNYNARDFEGAAEMPLFEDILSSRFAFRLSKRDGYASNGCGDAPPIEERVVRPSPVRDLFMGPTLVLPRNVNAGTENFRGNATTPGWSICGERVFNPTRAGPRDDSPPVPGYPANDPRRNSQVTNIRSSAADQPVPNPGWLQISPIAEGLPSEVNDRDSWATRGILRFQPTLDQDWSLTASMSRRNELSRLGQSHGTNGQITIPGCVVPADGSDPGACTIRGSLGREDSQGYQSLEAATLEDSLADQFQAQGLSEMDALNAARLRLANEIGKHLDPDPYHGEYNRVGPTENDIWGLALKGDIALGDSLVLTSVSGYDAYDRLVDVDLDQSPNALFEITTDDEGWQATQDLRLAGTLSRELPIGWELGGFTLVEELDAIVNLAFPPSATGVLTRRDWTQKLWSLAGYGSFDFDFFDDFTLDGGFRYNWERKTLDLSATRESFGITTDFDEKDVWQSPTGTLRLTYRFREDTHAYVKYTRGWKSGHYNTTAADLTGITTGDPEKIDAFETGLRGSWFQGRFELDTSLFHYSYEDYQIFIVQIPLGGAPEFVVVNADDAEVYGAEIDATARPFAGSFIQARLGWLESRFIDFVQTQGTTVQVGAGGIDILREIDSSGNPLLNSPQYKLSLVVEQTLPLGRFGSLTGRWDGAWTDDTNYDASEGRGIPNFQGDQILPPTTIGQEAYWLHNVRLGYRTPDGSIELAAWIRNLTDEVYKTFAFDVSGLDANKTTVYMIGEPRTYGLTLTATF